MILYAIMHFYSNFEHISSFYPQFCAKVRNLFRFYNGLRAV